MIEFSSSSASGGLEGSTLEGVRCYDSNGTLSCTQRVADGLVVKTAGLMNQGSKASFGEGGADSDKGGHSPPFARICPLPSNS